MCVLDGKMWFKVVLFKTWILLTAKGVYSLNQPEFCPDNVKENGHFIATYDETCYLFINIEKYWDEARAYCWHMGGEMLMVDSVRTMQFVQRQLNSPKLGWDRNGVWTGASDLRSRGWEWTTGERVDFTFWASGEPGKFLDWISIENCALMRRSDNWRWHDYHCHVKPFEYNFICQFPFVYQKHIDPEILHQQDHGAPLKVTDDKAAMIGLVIGGAVLIAVMCMIICYLHRKHQRQKALLKPVIRYQNTGYATIIQQSRDSTNIQPVPSSPAGNMYLEPNEVTRIYEEVAKDNVNHGVNSFTLTGEATRLVYQGGAASLENLEDNGYITPTTSNTCISNATSGYCSSNPVTSADTGEYLEMSAPTGLGGQVKNDLSLGANGSSSDVLISNGACENGEALKGQCQNGLKSNRLGGQSGQKCSNLYVTASAAATAVAKQMNKSAGSDSKSEMHIYTNQLEDVETTRMDQLSLRPLPPVPTNEKLSLIS